MTNGHSMGNAVLASTGVREISGLVGDTQGTPQHLTAGSWGTATAVPAVRSAAEDMMTALAGLGSSRTPRTPQQILRAAKKPFLEVESRHRAPGQPEQIFGRLAQGLPSAMGPTYPEFVSYSYIAHFVEVRIEPNTRRVRVPRVVSIADCGRVARPGTARSQMVGGVV